jgi:predicted phage baseplate assembly protein
MSKPLGVKEVINPLPATGGADQETRDQARENVPLALRALDRLVAVSDYADFARTFAGIGKASAARLSDGRRQAVHVTIAGAGDIPIDANSDLYRNLRLAFYRLGEPRLAVRVQVRELVLLVISARVRLLPDYLWELVEPRLRAALLDAYSFERRALGQDALLSEVVSVMHTVPGVAYVDVELFDSVAEADAQDLGRLAEKLAALAQASPPTPAPRVPVALDRVEAGVFRPAQVACLRAELPETLILEELRL